MARLPFLGGYNSIVAHFINFVNGFLFGFWILPLFFLWKTFWSYYRIWIKIKLDADTGCDKIKLGIRTNLSLRDA